MRWTIAMLVVGLLAVAMAGCGRHQADGERAKELPVDDLNGVAGKVFDLSGTDGRFRFLRQDRAFDPKTGLGPAWYEAFVTDQTKYIQKESRRNFHQIQGPVIAVFTGMDETNTQLLREGKLFRADQVVLYPSVDRETGISGDGQTIVAWFTPRDAKFSRDGTIQLGDKHVPAGVKRGGIRIFIEQARTAHDLNTGSWRATLSGELRGKRFVVDQMELQALPDQLADDDPSLPRVLSVGDSISGNYEQAARDDLKGVVNYHRIEDNCWSTRRGRAFIAYWLGDYTKPGRGWDVIHFNSGLHDMKQKQIGGAYAVPLEEYKRNLRIEIEEMRKTGATLVFCTTTPVQNDSGSAQYAFRTKGAEKDFNKAAREVLQDYPDILINDLAAFVNNSPEYDEWRKAKDVHFWKPEEQAPLGMAVADAIRKALDVRKQRQGE